MERRARQMQYMTTEHLSSPAARPPQPRRYCCPRRRRRLLSDGGGKSFPHLLHVPSGPVRVPFLAMARGSSLSAEKRQKRGQEEAPRRSDSETCQFPQLSLLSTSPSQLSRRHHRFPPLGEIRRASEALEIEIAGKWERRRSEAQGFLLSFCRFINYSLERGGRPQDEVGPPR